MKKYMTIWFTFVAFVFTILATTILVTLSLYRMAERLNLHNASHWGTRHTFVFVLAISMLFGTIACVFASKKLLRFIYQLQNGIKKVAAGDFTVQLEEGKHIGEVNHLLQDFNKMVQDLKSIETLKDDFVTNVSHEIKTPLAAMEGCIALLKEETLTPEERIEYVELIENSVKRLSLLTANIPRLSKLDNQAILYDQVVFGLDEQIRQAILLLEHKWSSKNMHLKIYLNPVEIRANKELLMQVWVNLIDNAIKFSKNGSDIIIELTAVDGIAYVNITDFGIGMAEETCSHIFQKFYQGDKSRSNQGNGLGLALVKRIVELSGGKIIVSSTPGRGSKFVVELKM